MKTQKIPASEKIMQRDLKETFCDAEIFPVAARQPLRSQSMLNSIYHQFMTLKLMFSKVNSLQVVEGYQSTHPTSPLERGDKRLEGKNATTLRHRMVSWP